MHQFTIAELVKGLRNKDFSSTEVTQHYLDRIARLDSTYNSFITVDEDAVLAVAEDDGLRGVHADEVPGDNVAFSERTGDVDTGRVRADDVAVNQRVLGVEHGNCYIWLVVPYFLSRTKPELLRKRLVIACLRNLKGTNLTK